MVVLNRKMTEMLQSSQKHYKGSLDSICEEIITKTKCINDCIVYDSTGELHDESINWNYVLRVMHDKTGFEMFQNEIDIDSDIFNSRDIFVFLLKFYNKLVTKYPNRVFCIILYFNGRGGIRFHTYRPEEGLWLSQEVDRYDNAILYLL